ncbi:uncharacterized protein LOC108163346 [Drosophila miranda]|uniref:uncharacterized protein LOC108163346 n=1 Tax=Drosophila miranda TaxID=7229 RepID=UPI0007E5F1B2|nr:uncharacterized protein LOC108163346 [Drosophila miranda]
MANADNNPSHKDEACGVYDLLSASPKCLKFCAPANRSQKRILTLLNSFQQPVIFKMKTNAVEQYHVTPFFGRIEPFSSLEVVVRLNGPEPKADCQFPHHLSVYSTFAPAAGVQGEKQSILAVFKDIPVARQAMVRISVEYEAEPAVAPAVAPAPAKPLRTSAASEIRSAAERMIASQVISCVSSGRYSASNAASAANQSIAPSPTCDPLESPPLNLETSVRLSLNDITIPSALQMFIVGAALAGVLYLIAMDPKKLDGVFKMLLGCLNMDSSEIIQCGKSDNTSPGSASASASAPSATCNMPDCCQGD